MSVRKKMTFRRPARRVNPNPLGAASSISLKQHESMVIEPSLFGDATGDRGDYSTGLFYAGRRKFLTDEKEALMPPSQFMTARQKRNHIRNQNTGKTFSSIAKLEFKKQTHPQEGDGEPHSQDHAAKRPLPVQKSHQTTVTIRKYASINPLEWQEVKQAGCTFYVHSPTGEISPEKPWLAVRNVGDTGDTSPTRSETSYKSFGADSAGSFEWESGYFDEDLEDEAPQDEEEQYGCGSLAYDGTEMKELLSELDAIPWSEERTPR